MTRHSYDEVEAARVKPPTEPLDGLFAVAYQEGRTSAPADPQPSPAQPDTSRTSVPGWVTTWGTMTPAQQKAQRDRWKELLRPVVLELVQRRGAEGIIAGDVIAEGIVRGILWGERTFLKQYGRAYSFIGPWLAQLAAAGTIAAVTERLSNGSTIHVTRTSERSLSHRNAGGVYVAREYAA
jgi:hypothetical protein